jgi:hypothetical protein
LDSGSLLSAGECLVVTTGTTCAVKMDSLITDAIRPASSGAAVVEIYYVLAHLACCFMQ